MSHGRCVGPAPSDRDHRRRETRKPDRIKDFQVAPIHLHIVIPLQQSECTGHGLTG